MVKCKSENRKIRVNGIFKKVDDCDKEVLIK
jgi:hypothetical protein